MLRINLRGSRLMVRVLAEGLMPAIESNNIHTNVPMLHLKDKVALVTGVSAGIGRYICDELVENGLTVVGCARDMHKIEQVDPSLSEKPGKMYFTRRDLTSESEIISMFDEIRQEFGRLDFCINNAGIIHDSPIFFGKTEDWREMFEVNVHALCMCTREAIKMMKDEGHIINISSIGGHKIPEKDPRFNFFCGTKFMVRAITEGLRQEIKDIHSRIRVSSISPGLARTLFLLRTIDPGEWSCIVKSNCLHPKDVSDAVIYILKSHPSVDIGDIILQPAEETQGINSGAFHLYENKMRYAKAY